MSVLENLAGRTTQWVIADTSYFDSATHTFMRGDIEIEGSKIERILPPKTSRRTEVLPGHEIVCVPGFINADTGLDQEDWPEHSHELARCGITTAGSFSSDLPKRDGFEGESSVRRLIYVELGESQSGDGLAGIDRQALERFERAANSRVFDRCTVLPAVVPREIWSAASLIAVTSLAERVGRRLCVRLSGTKADAKNYGETRFFSEIGLLSYLHILTANVTIFELSQLSRRDAIMLRESSASLVCAPRIMSEPSAGHSCTTPSFRDRAVGLALDEESVADLNRQASTLMSSTLTVGSESDTQSCNALVDALTHSAASALGLNGLGAIAANMKADLCLFDRPSDFYSGCNSLHFIRLLVGARPRHVLIDGSPVLVNGVFVGEVAQV